MNNRYMSYNGTFGRWKDHPWAKACSPSQQRSWSSASFWVPWLWGGYCSDSSYWVLLFPKSCQSSFWSLIVLPVASHLLSKSVHLHRSEISVRHLLKMEVPSCFLTWLFLYFILGLLYVHSHVSLQLGLDCYAISILWQVFKQSYQSQTRVKYIKIEKMMT